MFRELPPLNALRAFEAAARLHSASRAAQELHVTHGAISRQIRTLEDSLGRPLFHRQGRGLVLTSAGQELASVAGMALEQLRETWQRLQRDSRDAPLVLGCPGSLLARWVIPRMEALQADLPALRLHLAAQDSPFEATLPGLDAALLLAAPPWPGEWEVHTLATERTGPVVSPRYPGLERLADAPASSLLQESLLQTTSRPQAWPEWATLAGLDATSLRYGQSFAHLYYLLEAAVAGMGVAIAPEPLVADDLASRRLIAPWGFRQTSASWILVAPRRTQDARVRVLADWFRTSLGQD